MDSRFSACIEVSEIEKMRAPNTSMYYAREQASRAILEQVRQMIKFEAIQNHTRPTISVFATLDLPKSKSVRPLSFPKIAMPKSIKSFYQRLKEEIDNWIKL